MMSAAAFILAGLIGYVLSLRMTRETPEQKAAAATEAARQVDLKRVELELRTLEFKASTKGLTEQETAAYAALIRRRNLLEPPVQTERPAKKKGYRVAT